MEPLQVDIVHFYPADNAQPHNTRKYEVVNELNPTTAVVRRGQPFSGVVRFKRPIDEENDVVQLVFVLGENPQLDKETMGSVFIKRESVPEKGIWSARITDVQEDNMMFEVSTPVTLPVGSWSVRVVTRRKGNNLREVYDFESDLYILFNPWNPVKYFDLKFKQ
ncbi:hypothetical protein JYU34_014160 [Plutella xylostella]|uniref:Transglutaminase N-terminal domain-containing protein n=1 Tax=Plutella xylostella TaxID=51655 RepID=A0ABQ7Q7N9_PLUXY|nr:hypothetical protein JYU34_014160 [Plutella xylostella]